MGLRVLINPKEAEGHPKEMFLVGFVYALLSAGIATVIGRQHASLFMLLFTVIATIPIMFSVIKLEARRDENLKLPEYKVLAGHSKAVRFFVFLFLGFVAGYLLWFFLPGSESVFATQMDTIAEINLPTGQFLSTVGDAHYIFFNNLRLLMLSVVISVLFGAGIILVLAWNASVIATAMGLFVRDSSVGAIAVVPTVIVRYLIHGTMEMVAYFTAGLAGGILFIELIRHKKKNIKHVATDVVALLVIATILLYVAAWVEVGVIRLF